MLHDLKPLRDSDNYLDQDLMVWAAAIIRDGGNALVIAKDATVLEGPVYLDDSVQPNPGEFSEARRTDPEVKRAVNALYRRLMPDPGNELLNGARVLAARHTNDFIGIVAARYQGKYVTWMLNLQTGGAAHGNYFEEPTPDFWADYEERVDDETQFSMAESFNPFEQEPA